jgi:hypothetical protein
MPSLWRTLRVHTFRNLLADVASDVSTFMQSVDAAWMMVSLLFRFCFFDRMTRDFALDTTVARSHTAGTFSAAVSRKRSYGVLPCTVFALSEGYLHRD